MENNSNLEAELRLAQKEILRLETQLANSKQMYEDIFEGAGDSILIIDFDTDKIVDCNTNAARRLGYTKSELLKMEHDDIEQVEVNTTTTPFAYESLSSGTYVYESYHIHRDGTRMPVEVSSRLLNMGDRRVFMNFVRNLTERKEYEQRKIEYTLEHERAKILKQFIQNAGHEFRTPLSIIKTSIYLMSQRDSPELRQKHTEKISMQVDRISEFVDMMLLFTKLETENFVLDTLIHVDDFLFAVCERMRSRFGDLPKLDLKIADSLPVIKGNAEYLPMAFEQLIKNAYQFTRPDKLIIVRAFQAYDGLGIEIEDEGAGIQAEESGHIFELFWRADKSQTTSGFGLGLPIAEKIIGQHGGRIELVSQTGQNTTFLIVLPSVKL